MTTVGRRACLWCYDFVRDLEEIELRLTGLKMRGVRGATGTQASFLALFEGDARKVERLEKLVAKKLGFREVEPVVGQTYSRKVDAQIAAALGNIAVSAHKFANDVRLLAGMKEIEEPFEKSQVGSSAMAYKRNPMRCERMTGLARYALSMMTSPFQNAAEQWLERTLDDSANKRLSTPELFLTVDGILRLVVNVAGGMVVYPKVIESHIAAELPFMATEDILMAATKGSGKTGDRQELHERIRQHSQAAARQVKMEGQENDLMERLANDPAFAGVDLKKTLKADRYIGLSVQQVDAFLKDVARPILSKHRAARKKSAELNV
jgi:adenylosuccinate lyase